MNERIRELAKQAGFCGTGFRNTLPGTTQEDALKNFAELIVEECANIIHKRIGAKSALDILEHFGVEE